jgi:hypothetical protein
VTSVPWQLVSSARTWERAKRARQRNLLTAPGAVRRGLQAKPAEPKQSADQPK